MDDTSLAATSEYKYNPAQTETSNQQEEIKHMVEKTNDIKSTLGKAVVYYRGGAINLQKSHWYLMTWLWMNGLPKLAIIQQV